MRENTDNISKAVRAIISASVELAGGNITNEMLDAVDHCYTAKETSLAMRDGVSVAKRHYHTLKHPLDLMMKVEPSLKNMIDGFLSNGEKDSDEIKKEYVEFIHTLPPSTAKRLIALGISAPFHDLVYHVDGEIHPEVREQFLADVLNGELMWKKDADLYVPISLALSASDEIKLESMGSERLCMIAAEVLMHKCQINDPEIKLQVCTDIEATIAFRDTKYQNEFARRFQKYCMESNFNPQVAHAVLENAINFPNVADLGAFSRSITPELGVATETAVHAEIDKKITFNHKATSVDAANAFCRDFYFFYEVVLPGLSDHSRWAFRKVAHNGEWPEIKEDLEEDEGAKINVKERALLAGARSAAAALLIAAGFGETAIAETTSFIDNTLQKFERMQNDTPDSIAISVSRSLKQYTESSPVLNISNLDKLASVLLEKCPVSVIAGLASVIGDIVIEQGIKQNLPVYSIKQNLTEKVPLLIKQKLAQGQLDDLSQVIRPREI